MGKHIEKEFSPLIKEDMEQIQYFQGETRKLEDRIRDVCTRCGTNASDVHEDYEQLRAKSKQMFEDRVTQRWAKFRLPDGGDRPGEPVQYLSDREKCQVRLREIYKKHDQTTSNLRNKIEYKEEQISHAGRNSADGRGKRIK